VPIFPVESEASKYKPCLNKIGLSLQFKGRKGTKLLAQKVQSSKNTQAEQEKAKGSEEQAQD